MSLSESRPASFRIRLGISRCLLGDHVRYDGGHKRNRYLADVLSRDIEWVPVCPEVEAGLGTPREPMRLTGAVGKPKLLTIATKQDKTVLLERFSGRRVRELHLLNLSGYVFKARSPSCGAEKVPLYDRHGKARPKGAGLFARRFQKEFPFLPVIDEGRLADPLSRKHFLEQVFSHYRWQTLMRSPVTRRGIAQFHQTETERLQRHSRSHFLKLSRLVSQASQYRPRDLAARYGKLFMEALAVTPPTKRQPRALHSIRKHSLEKARHL